MNMIAFPFQFNNSHYSIDCTGIEDENEAQGIHYFIKVYKEKVNGMFYRSYHLNYKNKKFNCDPIEHINDLRLLEAIQEKLKNILL